MSRYRGEHKPLPDGRCQHRWANRVTRIVSCAYAETSRLRTAASRYRAAEWDIRCHEDSIRDEAHNARVEEWRAADASLAALLGETSPFAAPSAEPPETET